MATFNGATFVEEQIRSIQAQSVDEWRLIIRDDGSSDGTLEIIAELASLDSRITLLELGGRSGLGPSLNFSAALEEALLTDSDIFFLADQDDIWDVQKLSLQAAHFYQMGKEPAPLLVHSDLAIVDEGLNLIDASMVKYMGLLTNPELPLNHLLTRNFVTGCATACNRQLLEAAMPVSEYAIMHDWWLALTASALGAIEFVDKPLVRYRQHSANSLGAKGFWHGLNPMNNWFTGWKAGNKEYRATFYQVDSFLRHGSNEAIWPRERTAPLQQYVKLATLPAHKKVGAARKLGLRQGNVFLQAIFYVRLLTVRMQYDSSLKKSLSGQ